MRLVGVIAVLGCAGCASLLAIDPTAIEPDTDGDGIPDRLDNCPTTANPGQEDHDGNGIGDACDMPVFDEDGDGIADLVDNCPGTPGADQTDGDGDGVGDLCDLANDPALQQARAVFDGFDTPTASARWSFTIDPWPVLDGATAPPDPTNPDEQMTLSDTELVGTQTGSWYVQVGIALPLAPADPTVDTSAGLLFSQSSGTIECLVLYDHTVSAWRVEVAKPVVGQDNLFEGQIDIAPGSQIALRASFVAGTLPGIACEVVGVEALPALTDLRAAKPTALSLATSTLARFTYVDVVR